MSFGAISLTIRAAVEDDEPVGDLVHVREIVLDIDAGAAGFLDAADEVENLAAPPATPSAAVGSSSTIRSAS